MESSEWVDNIPAGWTKFQADGKVSVNVIAPSNWKSLEWMDNIPAGWTKLQVNGEVAFASSGLIVIFGGRKGWTIFRGNDKVSVDLIVPSKWRHSECMDNIPVGWIKFRVDGKIFYWVTIFQWAESHPWRMERPD